MTPPSVLTHIAGGAGLLFALWILFMNRSKFKTTDPYQILVIVLLFSIGLGLHGISHAILEKDYKYLPFYYKYL
jgi:hypothetical protein